MARTVRDVKLGSRNARLGLEPCGNPYWRHIEEGLHLGYRRLRGRAGTWWCRTYAGHGKYRSESIGAADDLSDPDGVAVLSFEQAQKAARKKMVDGAHASAGVKSLTVADVMAAYLTYLDHEKKSGHDARVRYEAFIKPDFDKIEISKLSTDQLRAWHRALAKKPARIRTRKGETQRHKDGHDGEHARRRKSSANRTLTVFKAALNQAFNDGKVTSDKEWRRVKPFKGVEAARVRFLSITEAKRLVNACEGKFRLLVQAALETGARYGELINLHVKDFNADSGTVSIAISKTGKPRHVVLTDDGARLFKRLCAGRSSGDVMLTKDDGTPWGTGHQARPMASACQRAHIKPISIHGLRHTWASLSVMAGMPLLVVAKNLGHSDTRMVERHYGHLAPDFVKEAIRESAPKFGFKLDNVASLA